MSHAERPPVFRYRLAPLLRRGLWERDELKAEALRERHRADEKERLQQVGGERLSQAQAGMRELHRDDAALSLETRRMAQLYLAQAYAAKAALDAEAQAAQRSLDEALARLDVQRVAVKALETHRERQRQTRDAAHGRAVQRASDESWLLRRR